jgi:hypothetical protein
MVADKEQLVCNSGGSFQISAVMDSGGFATLLKGQVKLNGKPQVRYPHSDGLEPLLIRFWPAAVVTVKGRKSVRKDSS